MQIYVGEIDVLVFTNTTRRHHMAPNHDSWSVSFFWFVYCKVSVKSIM